METEVFRLLERVLARLAHPRKPKVQFNDRAVVGVLLWAVVHDRPVSWACDRRNWPDAVDRPVPSQPTMSRRLRTVGVLQLLDRLIRWLADRFPDPLVKCIDSKPLAVGGYSKDRDADRGFAAGLMMRGYKFHAVTGRQTVRDWTLSRMSEHDSGPGLVLLGRLADRSPGPSGGYVAGDNAFDANALYDAAAAANHQLVAPPRKANAGKRDPGYNGPARRCGLDLADRPARPGRADTFGAAVTRHRSSVERCFGRMTLAGLALPAFVRTPRRVALWAAGKLAIDLCRRAKKQGLIS
jgi:hypothetical protein